MLPGETMFGGAPTPQPCDFCGCTEFPLTAEAPLRKGWGPDDSRLLSMNIPRVHFPLSESLEGIDEIDNAAFTAALDKYEGGKI